MEKNKIICLSLSNRANPLSPNILDVSILALIKMCLACKKLLKGLKKINRGNGFAKANIYYLAMGER